MPKLKKRKRVRRINKAVREQFGLPTAKKFRLAKNSRGTGRVKAMISGKGLIDRGSSYIAVLTQAELIAPSEVGYYAKRVGDIARRWLAKDKRNRVSVGLVTLFAQASLEELDGVDGITIGQRYEQFNLQNDLPDVGREWEFRNVYRLPPTARIDDARKNVRRLLKSAASLTGWQENDLDFLATFIMAIQVRKWMIA